MQLLFQLRKPFGSRKSFRTFAKLIHNREIMVRIEHIGIAVNHLEEANDLFKRLFGEAAYKSEAVDSENVNTSFFKVGPNKIELLESTDKDGAISKYISKRGEGIHHIAFEVDDIYIEMNRLKGEGFVLLNDTPKKGADNKLVCFLHPKSTNGVLVELCQEII
ncbi:MAG: methylmalonyl-CoA/ethylmalonyl-CoA epimerase [Cyclobacteriaceae bacterium]|jgi:methylmalonyl-CoA/ethylmalonyl-CoA epimerase